ncbi:MAG: response regulator [Spirochaetia bacterium]|nr:response regulator [Spirochaetia bacterium]
MRISVFLVEDELIIRENIQNNIDWEKEGINFIGAAADGELALPLILESKPDILISDIKMPFLDGIELATIIKKKLPKTKIIFLTGYKEFDLAKKAINIGVTDYLLKPITNNKILSLINDLVIEIESERENAELLNKYHQEMEEKKLISKNKFILDLLANKFSLAQILEKSKKYDFNLVSNNYSIILLKLKFKCLENKNDQLINDIYEALPIEDDWIIFNRGYEGLGVLCVNFNLKYIEDCKNKISQYLNQFSDITYFGTIGPCVNRISKIVESYEMANKAFAMRFFLNENNIIAYYKDLFVMEDKKNNIYLNKLQDNVIDKTYIKRFLKLGELSEISQFISELLDNIDKTALSSPSYRHYLLIDSCICCSDFLKSIKIPYSDLSNISVSCATSLSMEEFRDSLFKLLEVSINLRNSISWGKHIEIIEKAKAFMENNFRNKDISLISVANEMNISPNYLSALFSTETHETFIEYLTKLRLEKAKDLLVSSNLRSSEIAYTIGYQDAHYFSYIFKKYTSMSPRDYKKGVINEV